MDIQNMSEIRRPVNDFRNDKLRQQLSKIDMPTHQPKRSLGFNKKSFYLITGIIVGVVIIIGLLVVFFAGNSKNNGKWQAVFLANNQVYFGKVMAQNKYEIVLRDIYYLQDQTALQQGSVNDLNKATLDFTIIKLGKEIHGPEDEMRISRNQLLFVEDLRPDSKVVKAIEDYVDKNKQK